MCRRWGDRNSSKRPLPCLLLAGVPCRPVSLSASLPACQPARQPASLHVLLLAGGSRRRSSVEELWKLSNAR